ncbi:response regulator [Paenibacillus harenae]|uniref:CheY-like chemotaxis protein n=1 Tax=Paenibacillus harenae TaxID=306543 RepID=A0ABT9U5L8_PAEHA|nr:response regulator [Paenibacillus harenae]MDQ0114934.1 CheY-like chemotaxis protein [Paenibacillus harenae]
MGKIAVIEEIMGEREVKQYFETWLETIIRSRIPITAIFLKAVTSLHGSDEQEHHVQDHVTFFLQSKIRKTDLLFQLSDGNHWGIFFLQNSAVEAKAFLNRIFSILKEEQSHPIELKASITEIRNNDVTFEALINKNKQRLADHEQSSWTIEEIADYRMQPIEIVKVSIIEHNEIFRQVLEITLNQLDLPHFTFDITTYEDGYSFLEMDHYKTGQLHLILVNDILPRKNGFEILHNLRKMPNAKKFIIYMMSERNYEGAMLNAYEGGVDEYIIKPFNLRLLEAKIKRTFARFWL